MCNEKALINRWNLTDESSIIWNVNEDKRVPHVDHLEMSGKLVSLIVNYGVDESSKLILSQKVVWPTLRTIPNNTHASLIQEYKSELMPCVMIDGIKLK